MGEMRTRNFVLNGGWECPDDGMSTIPNNLLAQLFAHVEIGEQITDDGEYVRMVERLTIDPMISLDIIGYMTGETAAGTPWPDW